MSEADKLFEELGYKKKNKGIYVEYIKVEKEVEEEYVISFMLNTIMATLYKNGYITKPLAFNMQELKAINLKCKELGYIEE